MGGPLLCLEQVTMQFGGLKAVADLDLELPVGGLLGLIGPNGAGKTTVFNVITGVYTPTHGRILFDGRPIQGQRPHQIAATASPGRSRTSGSSIRDAAATTCASPRTSMRARGSWRPCCGRAPSKPTSAR